MPGSHTSDHGRYIHYGCGFCAPRTWRNFDASPTLRFEKTPLVGRLYTRNAQRFPENVEPGDIVKGLPVEPGSARAAYASHVLEHLALDDLRTALCNTLALLEPGGVFRLVVPDLEVLARRYLAASDASAAVTFMLSTSLGTQRRPRTLASVLRNWIGRSAHLWMWDYRSLAMALEQAGFVDIRRCVFGDSVEPRVVDVEDRDRVEDAVVIECRRSPCSGR